jgi:hypothetical protein
MARNDAVGRSDGDDETADAGGEVLLYGVCETTCAAGDVAVYACCLLAARLAQQRGQRYQPGPVAGEREHVVLLHLAFEEFPEAMVHLPSVENPALPARLQEKGRCLRRAGEAERPPTQMARLHPVPPAASSNHPLP